jgi:hypothetical protein
MMLAELWAVVPVVSVQYVAVPLHLLRITTPLPSLCEYAYHAHVHYIHDRCCEKCVGYWL